MALREPFGVCALIIPWNYPAQIFGRCVAAALAADNTVVLKPACWCSERSQRSCWDDWPSAVQACAAGEADADCGPLINARQKARLAAAKADGIRVMAQGRLADEAPARGHFVVPQLLVDIPAGHEELFGPVLAVQVFDDEAEVLQLANATDFGLCAGIWTRDGGRQLRLAKGIRSGQVFVNSYGAAGGIELPFGGVGRSGHGREKGFEGLKSYTCLRTVAIRYG